MDKLGIVGDPMIAHMVPSTFDPRSTSRVEDDDTQMMSLEGAGSESFIGESESIGRH